MKIPDTIKTHKPTQFGSCEIQRRGESFYVYLTTSEWDTDRKKPRKKTGRVVGKITEHDGFIANKYGMELLRKAGQVPTDAPRVVRYGAYAVMSQLNPELEIKLKEFFPDRFREIETIAQLRLIDGVQPKLIHPTFMTSYLSVLRPDLPMADKSVRQFTHELGTNEAQIEAFMRSMIPKGTKLAFDGTSFFADFADGLSAKGYNPQHSSRPQIRMIYIFDLRTKMPVFYRVVQGSMVDKTAFIDIVRASGCVECIIVADKGFFSKKNASALREAGMTYILPLQDNTAMVKEEFYANNDFTKFDGTFTYHNRPIYYKKTPSGKNGNFVYTFFDSQRWVYQQASFIDKAEKDMGENSPNPMDVLDQKRLGYYSFYSNLDTSAQEVYRIYKDRWGIEDLFDHLKNNIIHGPSYAHSDDDIRGWAFINHISLLYFYGLLRAMKEAEIDQHYTASDIILLAKEVYLVKPTGSEEFTLAVTMKKTRDLLDKLGVTLLT